MIIRAGHQSAVSRRDALEEVSQTAVRDAADRRQRSADPLIILVYQGSELEAMLTAVEEQIVAECLEILYVIRRRRPRCAIEAKSGVPREADGPKLRRSGQQRWCTNRLGRVVAERKLVRLNESRAEFSSVGEKMWVSAKVANTLRFCASPRNCGNATPLKAVKALATGAVYISGIHRNTGKEGIAR